VPCQAAASIPSSLTMNWTTTLTTLLDKVRGGGLPHAETEFRAQLQAVGALEPALAASTDGELKRRGERLRAQAGGAGHRDQLVVPAVALVREAAKRVLGQRMHDTQVLAAIALSMDRVVQLATGEGKTLAGVAPAWLSSLEGRGVHVLTFNDYLAARDAEWMGPVHAFLGAGVGSVAQEDGRERRRRAWACDITYATAKQAGFDYLRDQRVLDAGDRVHRPLHHAIVDEADSLMVDEARVPLVLAGGATAHPVDPIRMATLVRGLSADVDYAVDENGRNVALTPEGAERAERELSLARLYDGENRDIHAALNVALHAQALLQRDVDYVVRDGIIEVVDEFTGRVVADRRWPDGLHPALEAKEALEVRPEGEVLAAIPLQQFLPLYSRLSGMTATAVPASEEFSVFYGLRTSVVSAHRPCVRRDEDDLVFTDLVSKRRAVIEDVRGRHELGRPVLVGTASIAESESLAAELEVSGIPCRVLNAKNDEAEARIIAEAGRKGAVTISTNMAGRGTDIRLGGSSETECDEVVALGGLHVIGTNKHESRRIDEQLRGRAGRQGDPGSSRFYVSLEDDLVQRYGIAELIEELLIDQGPGQVTSTLVAQEIARAQRIVEGQNFDIRRTLWRYTGMLEQQRSRMGGRREAVLLGEQTAGEVFERLCPRHRAGLLEVVGLEKLALVERRVVLLELDRAWRRHLERIDDIREGIHLHQLTGQDSWGGLFAMRKTPFGVFHESAIAAFSETWQDVERSMVATYESLEPVDGELDLSRPDLKGPESTWTYVVNDTPFESAVIRMARGYQRRRRGPA